MNMVEMLRTWGGPQDSFEVVQANGISDAWTAELRARGTPALSLNLSRSAQDPRVWIAHRLEVPQAVNDALIQLLEVGVDLPHIVAEVESARAGSVTCLVDTHGSVTSVEIRAVLYPDGFSQHNLNVAVLEIARTRRVLSSQLDEAVRMSTTASEAKKIIQAGHTTADQFGAMLKSSNPAPVERRCPNGHLIHPAKKFCPTCGLPAV